MTGLRTAFQFLTVIPVPGGADIASAVRWCPLVGLVLGALLVGADALLAPLVGPGLRAALLVVLLAALTGAIHLDGLADSADGVLSTRSPEDRLAIMRDPRVGGFGVVAIVLVLLLKVAALTELAGGPRWAALLAVPALGRWAIVGQSALFRGARPGGLGDAWRRGATAGALLLATGTAWLPAVVFAGWSGLIIAASVALAGAGVGAFAAGRLGGVTGDIMGATVEITEAVGWIVAGVLARQGVG